MSLTREYVFDIWRLTEELVSNGHLHEGILLLDGLVSKSAYASCSTMPADLDALSRWRLADLLLQGTSGVDAALRVLEPCVPAVTEMGRRVAEVGGLLRSAALQTTAEGGTAPLVSQYGSLLTLHVRVDVLRLLSVANRRRSAYDAALRYLTLAEGVVAWATDGEAPNNSADYRDPVKATITELWAQVAVERTRVHYSIALDGGFRDEAALIALLQATEVHPRLAGIPAQAASWLTLAVAHGFALVFLGHSLESSLHVKSLIALVGDSNEVLLLHWLVEYSVGTGLLQFPAALPSSPPGKQQEGDSGSGQQPLSTSSWLSAGATTAAATLLRLLAHSAQGKSELCPSLFEELARAVEAQLKILQALSSAQHSPHVNAEVRFLVALKVVGYAEMALVDLQRLNLCEAACKLDPLIQYITSFHRHTSHFRALIHLLICLLAILLLRFDEVEAHVTEAINCGDSNERWTARLLLTYSHFLQRTSSMDHMNKFNEEMERYLEVAGGGAEIPSSSTAPAMIDLPNPRIRLGYGLLHGASHLDRHDYVHAAAVLKATADAAKQMFGVGSPFVAQALRLLATAHALAGNTEQSSMSITAAMQLATKNRDEISIAHSIAWLLSRLTVVTSSDVKQQTQLHETLEQCQAHYEAQLAAASNSVKVPEVSRVLAFLPSSSQYKSWLEMIELKMKGRGVKRRRC